MTNQELIAKFNPLNAPNLSAEDLETLRHLTDDQIDVLAEAFPNQPTRRAYLILYDQNVPENKQLYQLSTWQNLRNVRKFANRKNLIPWTFQSLFMRNSKQAQTGGVQARPSAQRVSVDLTANEAQEELKNALAKKSSSTQPVTAEQSGTKPTGQGNRPARKTVRTAGASSPNGLATSGLTDESYGDDDSIPDDQQMTNGE
jgi:hypothetical protein